jgi:hypothetical protein
MPQTALEIVGKERIRGGRHADLKKRQKGQYSRPQKAPKHVNPKAANAYVRLFTGVGPAIPEIPPHAFDQGKKYQTEE